MNLVDPAAIKQVVQNTFYPPPPVQQPTAGTSPGTTSVAPGRRDHRGRLQRRRHARAGRPAVTGADVGRLQGGQGRQHIAALPSTQVLYGTGAASSAARIAGYFSGVTAAAGSSVAAGHVEILLGTGATSVPAGIGSATPSASPASSPSASPTSSADNGQAGAPVTVAPNAKYGIPCVY